MSRRRYRSGASGMLMGGVIVAIGLLLLLDNMGIVRIHNVWRFWPAILIAYGVSRVLSCNTISGWAWGGTIALIGALLLLDTFDIVFFDFNLIWPILLIAFGASILLRAVDRKKYMDGAGSANPNLGLWAIFSGVKRRVTAQDFSGGEAVAIFGGIQVDLRGAAVAGERAVIDINALFGGVEIRIPETWNVNLKGVGVFGAFDDKTLHPRPDPNTKTPELVITGHALFGGVKVEN